MTSRSRKRVSAPMTSAVTPAQRCPSAASAEGAANGRTATDAPPGGGTGSRGGGGGAVTEPAGGLPDREELDALVEALERRPAERVEARPELLAEGLAGGPGEADPARARLALDALGHVDGVAVDPVAVLGDGAEVDPDAERQRPPAVAPDRLVPELALDLDRELQGVHRAREEGQDRVAGLVDDAPAVVGHELAEEGQGAGDPPPGAGLVTLHRGAEPLRVGVEDRGGPALEVGTATVRLSGRTDAGASYPRGGRPQARAVLAGAPGPEGRTTPDRRARPAPGRGCRPRPPSRLPLPAPRPVAGRPGLGRRERRRPGGGRDRHGGHHRSSPWREGSRPRPARGSSAGSRPEGRQVAAPPRRVSPRLPSLTGTRPGRPSRATPSSPARLAGRAVPPTRPRGDGPAVGVRPRPGRHPPSDGRSGRPGSGLPGAGRARARAASADDSCAMDPDPDRATR